MSKYQLPSAWSTPAQSAKVMAGIKQAPAKTEPKAAEVTAKIDMGENVAGAGLCPACRKPMQKGFLAGAVPVMVCFDDRVTLPVADADINANLSETNPDTYTVEPEIEANSETGFLGVSYVDN